MTQMPLDFSLPFVKKVQLSDDAWSFFFDRTVYPDLSFLPGQYVRMTLDVPQEDERGYSRFFSISSSPDDKNDLVITTRLGGSSFKKHLADISPGTAIKFFGPVGRFVLNTDEVMSRIFLAGGIGLTPFHSMITYVTEKKLSIPITLYVSFSTIEEIIFYDEFMKIAAEHSNIKIIYTITRPEESEKPWYGERGRISAELIKKYTPDFVSSQFYVSGPPTMVDAMLALIKENGVPDELVKKEKFIGY